MDCCQVVERDEFLQSCVRDLGPGESQPVQMFAFREFADADVSNRGIIKKKIP